jgi:hypothetical protein
MYAKDGVAAPDREEGTYTGADAGVTGAPKAPTSAGGSDAGVSDTDADAGATDPRLAMKCSVSTPGSAQGRGWLWAFALFSVVIGDLAGRRRRRH